MCLCWLQVVEVLEAVNLVLTGSGFSVVVGMVSTATGFKPSCNAQPVLMPLKLMMHRL